MAEQARRCTFSAEYKLRIPQEADAFTQPGEIGGYAVVRLAGRA